MSVLPSQTMRSHTSQGHTGGAQGFMLQFHTPENNKIVFWKSQNNILEMPKYIIGSCWGNQKVKKICVMVRVKPSCTETLKNDSRTVPKILVCYI